MSISLSKGANVSLTKTAPGLQNIGVGLGWDARATDGAGFDLDAVAFLLGTDEKVRGATDFVFYNQLRSPEGAVEHTGDNRTGEGEGDDELINVHLELLPPEVQKVAIGVTIHESEARAQNFGMVRSAFIRVFNSENGTELARYDLSEDASVETAMVFGEVYRHGAEWKFRAVGQGFQGGLASLAGHYGVNLG